MDASVALPLELASHVFYVPAILVLLYTGRMQVVLALLGVIASSMHYHVCLATDGATCLTTLYYAGAGDYFFAYLAGAVLYLQSNAMGHDAMSASLMVVVFELFWMAPVMYESFAPFVVVSASLLWMTAGVNLLLRRRSPYHNPGISWIVCALSLVSYLMLALPFKTGSFYYDVTHPIWHALSGTVIFFYAIFITRLVVLWVRWSPRVQVCYTTHFDNRIQYV